MMLQELYDRWTDIQKRYSESRTTESASERIEEELNILEALRIFGGKEMPGETSDVKVLISERHKKWDDVVRERKEVVSNEPSKDKKLAPKTESKDVPKTNTGSARKTPFRQSPGQSSES